MRFRLVLLALLAAAGLIFGPGCADTYPSDPNDPDDPDDPNDPDPEVFDATSAAAALATGAGADSVYRLVMAADGVDAANAAALAFFETDPAVSAAGVSEDSTVWARFANGLLIAVYGLDRGSADLATLADPASAFAAAAKGGGEAVGEAVIMTPFAHEFGDAAETRVAAMIDTCFGSDLAAATTYTDTEVTVARLARVLESGPGVLLYSSHGVIVPREGTSYWVALTTGETGTDEAMVQNLVDEYELGATGTGLDMHYALVFIQGRPYVAVTPAFIAAHADFDGLEGSVGASKSLVYACCCCSGHPQAGLADAFHAGGVDYYLGWSRYVGIGFAADAQQRFFRQAVDTCLIDEAYAGMGGVVDPSSKAQLVLHELVGSGPMILRAQMPFTLDGGPQHTYSVGVALANGVTTVSGFAGEAVQAPELGVTVHAPGAATGTWDCVAREDALIMITDFRSGRIHIVQKDYMGVEGEVEIVRYDDDVISGRFSGTLGYWSPGKDPTVDEPATTMIIEDGVFKHAGPRF